MVPAGEVEPTGQLLQPRPVSSLAQYWFAAHMSTRSSERSSSRRMGAVSSSRRMGAVRVVAIRAAARAHVIRKRIFFNRAVADSGASTILQRRAALQRRHQASAIATQQRLHRAYAFAAIVHQLHHAPQRPRSIHNLELASPIEIETPQLQSDTYGICVWMMTKSKILGA